MIVSLSILELLLAAAASVASPLVSEEAYATTTSSSSGSAVTGYDWDAGAVADFTIHESCNSTERAQLQRAFADGIKLAHHAKSHILRWGNESSFYQKYFGSAATAEPIGWYERLIAADRGGVLFRCDDIDGNCRLNPTWGGHWRGSNGSDETVICPPSYTSRWYLEGMCGYGYTVASGNVNAYFGSDMMHRWFHLTAIGEGIIDHYADDYLPSLELARTNPEQAVRNSDTIQYFALDVYAYDIAVPGKGCTGEGSPVSSSEAAYDVTTTILQTSTASASASCHTHSDGTVHCD